MSLVTVVTSSYNRRNLLDQTLHSLTNQSYTDFKVIVVDHGSTDKTEEVFQKYQDLLHITYYKIERGDHYTPGVPKDFGVRKADTPLIVLLDTGVITPPWYIETHLAFHRQHPNAYAIGLQHGYRSLDAQSGYQQETQIEDFRQAYLALQEANLQDQRTGIDLERTSFPWFFAWGANLSFSREAYLAVGGTNTQLKGWGFEDADLGYRMSKYGLHLALVEDGWVIELPQARKSTSERFQSNLNNMLQCYNEQRTLALEAMTLTILQLRAWIMAFTRNGGQGAAVQIDQIGERMRDQFLVQATMVFRYLTTLKQDERVFAARPDFEFARPALLIGGTAEDSEHFDYVAVSDEQFRSTPSTWSCSAILIPLPDQSLETVVVSPVWKKLGWSIPATSGLSSASLLEKLVTEIQRSAKKAIFLEGPAADNTGVSPAELAQICERENLDYQIVAFSAVH